jgi:hypothetical protein
VLAMATQFTASAAHAGTAASTGKKARTMYARDTAQLADCSGSIGHHKTQDGFEIHYYTKPTSVNHSCVGTIRLNFVGSGGNVFMSGWVHTINGNFCKFGTTNSAGGRETGITCREAFTTNSLHVHGQSTVNPSNGVTAEYPFANNGIN